MEDYPNALDEIANDSATCEILRVQIHPCSPTSLILGIS